MKSKRKREESPPLHLSDDDDPYDEREEDMRIGKKRVGDVSCYQVFVLFSHLSHDVGQRMSVISARVQHHL